MESVVTGDNQYCGPAVLSILTGKSSDECADIFRKVDYSYAGKEVSVGTIKKALDYMEFESNEIITDCSLFALMHQIVREPAMYLVIVPKHVVALEVTQEKKIWFCDNHTKNLIDAAHSARIGQRVSKAFKVTPRPIPKFGINEMKDAIVKALEYGPNSWRAIYNRTGQRPQVLFSQAKNELIANQEVEQINYEVGQIEYDMVFLREHKLRLEGWNKV